jgi:hypothetical protein
MERRRKLTGAVQEICYSDVFVTAVYRNWRINNIANPIKISHNITINTANNLNLGDRSFNPVSLSGWGVPMAGSGVGVIVAVGVGVEAGNINVIAGNGIRVVVAVVEGVIVGVEDWSGVLEGPTVDCVTVPGVPDWVAIYSTAACTGFAAAIINIHTNTK